MAHKVFQTRVPVASALIVAVAVGAGAAGAAWFFQSAPYVAKTGGPELARVAWDKAVDRSQAGEVVIVDLREEARRTARPVPGGAVVLPPDPRAEAWAEKRPLLRSLERTPLLLLVGDEDWKRRGMQLVRALRNEQRDLRRVREPSP
jgi:hypothetical protein